MPFTMFDPTIILVIPALLLSIWASSQVKTNFEKFSQVYNKRGLTGVEVAMELLRLYRVNDVSVEHIGGSLSDHYDPTKKVVRLSDDVYDSRSLAALSVAAHEVGHAIQHNVGYVPLQLRSSLFPIVSLASNASIPLFMLGLLFTAFGGGTFGQTLMLFGIFLFIAVVFFQVVTLPVEFDASRRALIMLEDENFLDSEEIIPAKKVLKAAALTYVAAALSSLSQLIRLLVVFNNSRRDD